MLSTEDRRDLWQDLNKEFSRPRALTPGLKEAKLKAATRVLEIIADFTTAQQGQILRFSIDMITNANDKFWRDNAYEEPAKKKGRKPKKT